MDTAQFLARAVAPGNYLAVAYNRGAGTPVSSLRMFPHNEIAQAAGFLAWISKKNWDGYHAQCSFTAAVLDGADATGKSKYRGERRTEGIQRLKSFWVDLDVKRVGDKKKAEDTFATRADAMTWFAEFRAAHSLPRVSMVIDSGYGMHAYWVLEDALTYPEWLIYADALKAALVKANFKGDAGISADGVRLLRPSGTVNMKSGTPAPVSVISRLSGPDVPNAMMFAALRSFVGLMPHKQVATMTGTATALAGGNVSSIFQATPGLPNVAAAAAMNMPARVERQFALMAAPGGCDQVKASLTTQGNGDTYTLWYLGFLSAAVFTTDGAAYVHEISKGDPRYSAQAVDAAFARATSEQASKGVGWPSCALFERARSSVCLTCPHHGRLTSPLDLAIDGGDLPHHYRRARGGIEVFLEGQKDSGGFWLQMIVGDVFAPVLDEQPGRGYELMFKYGLMGKIYDVHVVLGELTTEASAIYKMMQAQKIILTAGNELRWRNFLLAWSSMLRTNGAVRSERIAPFGWAKDGVTHLGFAYAGTLYRADGTRDATPAGDREIMSLHRPQGDLTEWQKAATFTLAGRPDLQAIVASAFAAPLVKLTGHKGLLMSAWSRASGVGKSSALTVAQAVWGAPGAGMSLDDTHASVRRKIAETRNLPAYWDEMRTGGPDEVAKFVQFVFAISQGKERARLDRDATLKPIGEWETMITCAANAPLMDSVIAETQGTEAGALRVFEFQIIHPAMPQNARAAATVQLATENYGRAGEIYAAWLAANYDKVRELLVVITDKLIARSSAHQSERLHLATMATLLAGAHIATKLGLVAFDTRALEAFLVSTLDDLRAARSTTLLVGPAGYDLEEILGGFWTERARTRLVTDTFGRGGMTVTVRLAPFGGTVELQVSQSDQMMRVPRAMLFDYIRRKGLPPSDVLATMRRIWGVTCNRRTLGGGTPYGSGGSIHCIEIPLTVPELAHYTQVSTQAAAASAATVSRAAALQGATMPASVQALGTQGATP